jgi:hypothetical protein
VRTALRLLADPPLDPSGDEARSSLRRELARPEYYTDDLLERAIRWVQRLFDDGLASAANAPLLSTFLAILVALALIVGVLLLVSRIRRTARTAEERRPALPDEAVTAAEMRARATSAYDEGRYADALVDGYRALALQWIERGRIEDLPQATAHELARALAAEFPDDRPAISRAADLFDEVHYGDHPVTREQAAGMLALGDEIGTVRR